VNAAETPNLTIVVPAFNEGPNLEPVVREIVSTVAANPWVGPYEIVLVNDGSRDDSAATLARLAGEVPQLRVFHHETNRGFGAALKTGFTNSRGRAVGFISADGEIGVDQPLRLFQEMGETDLMLSGRARSVGAGRSFLTWGVNWTSRLLLGFWPDDSVGIWVIRGDLLRSLPLYSNSGLVNLEIILHCKAQHRSIVLSGVTQARPRLSGESKVTNLSTILQIFWEMWKLRWRIRRQNGSS
jgi:glycosyltransferase involved in cell wall biosynthesis